MIEIELNSMQDLQRLVVAGFENWKAFGEVYTKRLDDLILFNYLPTAQINNRWTWLETVSRGLILNAQTGEVVARPFDKFFNWMEGGRLPTPGSTIRTITEKMDGSLGILLRHQGKYRIATRGSFESEQALWATDFLNANYDLSSIPANDDMTFLFEIIYPDNRIVVDYGREEKLVLLAIRNRVNGMYLSYEQVRIVAAIFGFSIAPSYSFTDMDSLLKSTADIDHEGFVVEFSDGSRFKIKGEKYRQIHKVLSHVSYNSVLDALLADGWLSYKMSIPEEFWEEVDGYHAEIMSVVDQNHAQVMATMTPDHIASFPTRRDLAGWVQTQPREMQRFYFNLVDGKYKREDQLKIIPRRNVRTRVDRGEA